MTLSLKVVGEVSLREHLKIIVRQYIFGSWLVFHLGIDFAYFGPLTGQFNIKDPCLRYDGTILLNKNQIGNPLFLSEDQYHPGNCSL